MVGPSGGPRRAALGGLRLDAPVGQVDREAVPFPWGREVDRVVDDGSPVVGKEGAVGIFHVDHVVVEVDRLLVRVLRRVLQGGAVGMGSDARGLRGVARGIVPLEVGATLPLFFHRKRLAVRGEGAMRAPGAVKCVAPQREDRSGVILQPPVEEVKMVAALVQIQAAGAGQLAVPAQEVAGAVGGIDQVAEVHLHDLPERAAEQEALDGALQGPVAGVEGDSDTPPGFPFLRHD